MVVGGGGFLVTVRRGGSGHPLKGDIQSRRPDSLRLMVLGIAFDLIFERIVSIIYPKNW